LRSGSIPSWLAWLRASCVAVVLAFAATTGCAQVLVVISDESASYQEVAAELQAQLAPLRNGRLRIDVAMPSQVAATDERGISSYELIVTVGVAAAQSVATRQAASATPRPTLCLLIPRQSFEKLSLPAGAAATRGTSAVFIDQPLSRQLDLIRIALPDKDRVGVVLGPNSRGLERELRDRAQERRLVVNASQIVASTEIYGALQSVLRQSDLLLAIADPVAFTASTAYGVLLTSYHAQIPVVGFSESLVKAGALIAVFSTPREQGRQGAEIAGRFLAGDAALPAPQFPRYFTVAVNYSVARSLGLAIQDEAAIGAALAARTRAAVPSDALGAASVAVRGAR
jgi:ABC-type uncharacterized transport system substrate-binding protein